MESPLSGASLSPQRIARRTYGRGLRTSARNVSSETSVHARWPESAGPGAGGQRAGSFHVFKVRTLQAHCRFKPVEGACGIAPLCIRRRVEGNTAASPRRADLGERGLSASACRPSLSYVSANPKSLLKLFAGRTLSNAARALWKSPIA